MYVCIKLENWVNIYVYIHVSQFFNVNHLSKYIYESYDRKDLLSSKFSDKCKKSFQRRKDMHGKF